ncbi:MAG: hypothetical protein K2I23_05400 [Clostridia bacterium]|nr:hypothetical protein [Clostridia bacterium]
MKKKVVLSVAVVLLVVMVAVMCVACTPTQKSVMKKFEDKGYTVVGKEDSKVISCTKVSLSDPQSIIITWFDNEDDAKDAYEAALEAGSKETVKRKGNAVAVGTKDAVKLF